MASIGRDGASWYYVVSNGTDPITFKPRQIKKRGFKTKEEAEIAAMEVELLIRKHEYFKGENMSFQALYEEWIESYALDRKQSSVDCRKKSLKCLLKAWGNTPIKKITTPVYTKFMNSLVQTYEYNTREITHISAKLMFDYAVNMDYLKENPTEKYRLPKGKAKKQVDKKDFLEKEELAVFLGLAKSVGLEHDYEFFSLLAFTGIRIGEALTLKWIDVDFENSSISINKTLYNPNNNKRVYDLTDPKTMSSNRIISIDPFLLNTLKEQKKKQTKQMEKYKDIYDNEGFIFTCEEGRPYSRTRFASRIRRLMKRMEGLNKHITPHSFRHTHASLLLEANANMKVISHRLGHATVATTDETYGHLTRGLEKKASQQFSELMRDLVDFNEINASDHTLSDANHDQKYDH